MKKNVAFFVGGVILILSMLLFYNNVRIGGAYQWGLSGKEYAFNFIPFKDFFRMIEFFEIKVLQKIAYFMGLGLLEYWTISQLVKVKTKYFILPSVCVIGLLELLVAFSSKSLVIIDCNNFILYAVGLAVGYLLPCLLKRISGLLNLRVKFVISQAN